MQAPKPVARKEPEEEEEEGEEGGEEQEEVSSDDSASSGFLTHDTFEEHFSAKKAARKSPFKRYNRSAFSPPKSRPENPHSKGTTDQRCLS
jgi:hypothetical protein